MNLLKDLQRDIFGHVTAGSRQLEYRQHDLVSNYVSVCASIAEVRNIMEKLQLTESDLFLIYHKLALAGLSQYVNGHVVSLSVLAHPDALAFVVGADRKGTEILQVVSYLLTFFEELSEPNVLLNLPVEMVADKIKKEKRLMWITDVEASNPPVNLSAVLKIEPVEHNKICFGNSCTWLLDNQQQRDAVLGNIIQLLESECLITRISRECAV